jgi:glycerophosphoryl diester phosphodiesterase
VERLHSRGHRVHVWTVDDQEDIDYVLGLGVDAVISNYPGRVLRSLDRV